MHRRVVEWSVYTGLKQTNMNTLKYARTRTHVHIRIHIHVHASIYVHAHALTHIFIINLCTFTFARKAHRPTDHRRHANQISTDQHKIQINSETSTVQKYSHSPTSEMNILLFCSDTERGRQCFTMLTN